MDKAHSAMAESSALRPSCQADCVWRGGSPEGHWLPQPEHGAGVCHAQEGRGRPGDCFRSREKARPWCRPWCPWLTAAGQLATLTYMAHGHLPSKQPSNCPSLLAVSGESHIGEAHFGPQSERSRFPRRSLHQLHKFAGSPRGARPWVGVLARANADRGPEAM